MDVAVVLLTVIALAAVLALAPRGAMRRRSRARRSRRRPRKADTGRFLAVCRECQDIVEEDARTTHCPSCGAQLVVKQRIVDQRPRRRSRTPVSR